MPALPKTKFAFRPNGQFEFRWSTVPSSQKGCSFLDLPGGSNPKLHLLGPVARLSTSLTKLAQLCDIEDSEAFYKYMDASIINLEMTAGDNTVQFTSAMKPDEWEDWMEHWTLAVEGVKSCRPFLYEMNDIVDPWGRKCRMDITDPRMLTYRLDETTPDE